MNLSEAFDAALPEIPKARLSVGRPPLVDPNMIVREEVLDGELSIGVMQRSNGNFFRFTAADWGLVQLFDGNRTYEDIAQAYFEGSGHSLSVNDIRVFAEQMEEADFWYKTPQEKNLAMSERLRSQRSRRSQRKSKVNLAHISFSAWDPDRYLTWLDRAAGGFIFSPWSVLAVVALFCFEFYIFVAHWNVIGPDIPVYYSFTGKTFSDIAEFWILLFLIGFVHETAHGLTCKHFGGEVHSMGLMFLYLAPAFYVDVTESWVTATRIQRLWTIIAGIWIEMVICGIAMALWVNTPPGYWLHDLMYKVILITGVAVIVMNLNPLLKLDGYYFLTEAIGIPDLKEKSTAFVSTWVQSRVLRLPVEVSPVPRRRILLFICYALISGAYSYLVLFAVIRFSYNVLSQFIAEFALIPVAWMAYMMFRSRIRALAGVAQQVRNQAVGQNRLLKPKPLAALIVALLVFFIPLWRDREDAYYVVEPANPVSVHAAIAGRVTEVHVRAGQHVRAGDVLLRMSSLDAASMRSDSAGMEQKAQYRAFDAELRGQSVGVATAERVGAERASALSQEAQKSLTVTAPADGAILDLEPASLRGNMVGSGQQLLALAGDGPHVVRIYIPFSALHHLSPEAEVLLMAPGAMGVERLRLSGIDSAPVQLPPDFVGRKEYKGIELPTFYCARIEVPANAMPLGAAGQAKVLGKYHSIFERCVRAGLDLIGRHIW